MIEAGWRLLDEGKTGRLSFHPLFTCRHVRLDFDQLLLWEIFMVRKFVVPRFFKAARKSGFHGNMKRQKTREAECCQCRCWHDINSTTGSIHEHYRFHLQALGGAWQERQRLCNLGGANVMQPPTSKFNIGDLLESGHRPWSELLRRVLLPSPSFRFSDSGISGVDDGEQLQGGLDEKVPLSCEKIQGEFDVNGQPLK